MLAVVFAVAIYISSDARKTEIIGEVSLDKKETCCTVPYNIRQNFPWDMAHNAVCRNV